MPSIETLVWVLTACLSLLSVLSGVIWKMIRDETKEHATKLEKKADTERLKESEQRWNTELSALRNDNKELITRIESRHEREINLIEARLSQKMETLETNMMAQLKLIMEILRKD